MRIVLTLALSVFAVSAFGADACQQQIPRPLSIVVAKAFPKFRSPIVTDNLPEDNDYNLKQGGTGCIAVATGDLNGDGKTDFVIGLTAQEGAGGLIVVALASNRSWRLKVLDEWKDSRIRLFVDTREPGIYTHTAALDTLEKGEVERLVCRTSLAAFGATESSEVVYCYSNGKWPHVWISD